MPAPNIMTERLILRQWNQDDLSYFSKINADKKVMEFFPSTLSSEESNALAEKIQKELQEKNYGLWAVEVKDIAPFIGFIGLHYQDFPSSFTPCIEIGWRIAYEHWGKGYAFEAGSKVAEYAFNVLNLDEIVSLTSVINTRSRRLMEKLGMIYNPEDDFNHAKLPEGHPLRPHVLYRLKNWNTPKF